MNFADMNFAEHQDEAAAQYKRISHYANSDLMDADVRNDGIKEALMWATYHSEQAPIKQAAEWVKYPEIKLAYDRKEAAGKRLAAAHRNSTHQEFNADGAEWTAAFAHYEDVRND